MDNCCFHSATSAGLCPGLTASLQVEPGWGESQGRRLEAVVGSSPGALCSRKPCCWSLALINSGYQYLDLADGLWLAASPKLPAQVSSLIGSFLQA